MYFDILFEFRGQEQISTEDCCQEFILKEVDLISSNTSASNDGQASVEFGRLISWPASGMSNASETCEFPEKVIVLSGPRVHLFAFKEDEGKTLFYLFA